MPDGRLLGVNDVTPDNLLHAWTNVMLDELPKVCSDVTLDGLEVAVRKTMKNHTKTIGKPEQNHRKT